MYMCVGNPFPGPIPPNSMVGITIAEVENENALAAVSYALALAGMSIYRIPIMEMKPGQSAATEKRLKGLTWKRNSQKKQSEKTGAGP